MKELRALMSGALLLAFVLVGVIGIAWATSAQYQQTADATYSVLDEPQTADVGNWTAVDAPSFSRSFGANETLVESGGTQLVEGSDYEWNTSTGEVLYYATSNVQDGEEILVDYTYTAPSQEARTMRDVMAVPIGIILPTGVLIVAAMAIAGLGVGLVLAYRRLESGQGSAALSRR